ncbi:MAG TPA: DUF3108 domain-containing protein [Caulobacteraceae bacterium]|jgi:hypothetical protein|nr:DUF3108 domain-containing protein [Caulobacteraceae bacterium]
MDAGRSFRLGLSALAGAGVGACPAVAQGPGPGPFHVSLGYDGRLILKVLDIEVEATAAAQSYSASARLRSLGVLAAFKHFDTRAEARGRIAGGQAWPGTFHSQNLDGKANRRTDVVWSPETVTSTINPPVRSMGDPPATSAQKLEAIDPVSGVVRVALAAEPCGRTLRFFDGKQRYDLDFTTGAQARPDAREQRLGLTHPVHCAVKFREVAGFKKKPPSERNQGLKHPIAVGFARVGANGPWVISSASSQTPLGAATITLQRVKP